MQKRERLEKFRSFKNTKKENQEVGKEVTKEATKEKILKLRIAYVRKTQIRN